MTTWNQTYIYMYKYMISNLGILFQLKAAQDEIEQLRQQNKAAEERWKSAVSLHILLNF